MDQHQTMQSEPIGLPASVSQADTRAALLVETEALAAVLDTYLAKVHGAMCTSESTKWAREGRTDIEKGFLCLVHAIKTS